jgi:hypothetical protein
MPRKEARVETMYFFSYIVLAVLFVFALAAGGIALLVEWLQEHRPWRRDPEEDRGRVTPSEPMMRFPSRP